VELLVVSHPFCYDQIRASSSSSSVMLSSHFSLNNHIHFLARVIDFVCIFS
jgi:hypothetical protein